MRNFFFLLFLAFSISSFAQKSKSITEQKTDWEADKLNGKVRFISEVQYEGKEKFGEVVRDKKESVEETEFNRQGFITEINSTNPNSKKEFTEKKYTYDSKMNLTSYKLNESGKKVAKEYEYNKLGQRIEENNFDVKGNLSAKYKFTYDSDGNKIKSIKYKGDGSLEQTRQYIYENGNLTKEKVFDNLDKQTFEYDYMYDDKNNLLKETFKSVKSNALTIVSIETSTYNESGKRISFSKITDGKKVTQTYEYDSNGMLLKYNNGNTDYNYTYVYDKYNNWTTMQMTYLSSSKKIYVIYDRAIKYF